MLRLDFTEDVVILAGRLGRRFVVHKNVLCSSSGFLKKLTNGGWKEESDRQLRLPEADAEAFEIYVAWLYTGKPELWDSDGGDIPILSAASCKRAFNAYTLGYFLDDRRFCNVIVDEVLALSAATETIPPRVEVGKAYGKLPRTCGLCRLLVDIHACHVISAEFNTTVDEYPMVFVMDMARVAVKERALDYLDRLPERRGKCYYHDHKHVSDECAWSKLRYFGGR